jgi:hypothetical protein
MFHTAGESSGGHLSNQYCAVRILEFKAFWRWCVTLRITGIMGFVHSPELKIGKRYSALETGSVPVLGWGEENTYFVGFIGKSWNQSLVLRLHEDGNRSSFRNVLFPIYFEFWTMDKDQKRRDSGYKYWPEGILFAFTLRIRCWAWLHKVLIYLAFSVFTSA